MEYTRTPSALGVSDGRVHIRILKGAHINIVDAGGDHENLAPRDRRVGRPSLNEIGQREIRACCGAVKALCQPHGFGRSGMILCEILSHENGAILHVAHGHKRRRRLLADEGPNLTQFGAQANPGAFIDENGQSQPGFVSLRRNPAVTGRRSRPWYTITSCFVIVGSSWPCFGSRPTTI